MSDKPFYVLVTGGRDYRREDVVRDALHIQLMAMSKRRGRRLVIVHGNARGADSLAKKWAEYWDCPSFAIPAEWNKLGDKAGSKRNQQMLDWLPIDLVIAFPGGVGTRDMVTRAEKAKIEIIHAGEDLL